VEFNGLDDRHGMMEFDSVRCRHANEVERGPAEQHAVNGLPIRGRSFRKCAFPPRSFSPAFRSEAASDVFNDHAITPIVRLLSLPNGHEKVLLHILARAR